MHKPVNIPTIKEFLEEVKEFNPHANLKLIEKAFNLSKKAHKDQKRTSGDPFFTHPVEVARTLMKLSLDSATICAGLMHDVIEDTKMTHDQMVKLLNKEIADLVESLTKIEKFKFANKEEYTNENIRKVLLASSKDIRIILIKLADRLHNLQTLKFKPKNREIKARVTLEIFAPIAEKLGLFAIKGELEDLALRYLDPKSYQILKNKVGAKRIDREKQTKQIVKIIQTELNANKIEAKVFGRAKYFYSIYKKMKAKDKSFDEIFDLIGIRIITAKEEECYAVLNILHNLWPHKRTRFKDYIKFPKDNGYRSIHTNLYGPYNKVLEVQIRDIKMHHEAEGGVAAHWKYAGSERDKEFDRRIQWYKQAIEWRRFSKNSKEFIEGLKMDFYENEIIILTPKGDPIPMKEGSTPLDFAYEVHTSIGNNCQSAIVNGKAVQLDHKLKSGNMVQIITNKKASPKRTWLRIVTTNRAKQKIRHALGITKNSKISRDKKNMGLIEKIRIPDMSINARIKIGRCCSPKINDPIVGFLTDNNTVTIHNLDCPQISIFDKKNRVRVLWKIKERNISNFAIKVKDRAGLLSEILNVFSIHNIKVDIVTTKIAKKNVFIRIHVKKIEQVKLDVLSKKLKAISNVIELFLS